MSRVNSIPCPTVKAPGPFPPHIPLSSFHFRTCTYAVCTITGTPALHLTPTLPALPPCTSVTLPTAVTTAGPLLGHYAHNAPLGRPKFTSSAPQCNTSTAAEWALHRVMAASHDGARYPARYAASLPLMRRDRRRHARRSFVTAALFHAPFDHYFRRVPFYAVCRKFWRHY